jgi:hypothetical protein
MNVLFGITCFLVPSDTPAISGRKLLVEAYESRAALRGVRITATVKREVDVAGRSIKTFERITTAWSPEKSRTRFEDLTGEPSRPSSTRTIVRDGDQVVVFAERVQAGTGIPAGVRVLKWDATKPTSDAPADPRFLGIHSGNFLMYPPSSLLNPGVPKSRIDSKVDAQKKALVVSFEGPGGATTIVEFPLAEPLHPTSFATVSGERRQTRSIKYRKWEAGVFPETCRQTWFQGDRVTFDEDIRIESFELNRDVTAEEVSIRSLGIPKGRAVFLENDFNARRWDGEKIVVEGADSMPAKKLSKPQRPPMSAREAVESRDRTAKSSLAVVLLGIGAGTVLISLFALLRKRAMK